MTSKSETDIIFSRHRTHDEEKHHESSVQNSLLQIPKSREKESAPTRDDTTRSSEILKVGDDEEFFNKLPDEETPLTSENNTSSSSSSFLAASLSLEQVSGISNRDLTNSIQVSLEKNVIMEDSSRLFRLEKYSASTSSEFPKFYDEISKIHSTGVLSTSSSSLVTLNLPQDLREYVLGQSKPGYQRIYPLGFIPSFCYPQSISQISLKSFVKDAYEPIPHFESSTFQISPGICKLEEKVAYRLAPCAEDVSSEIPNFQEENSTKLHTSYQQIPSTSFSPEYTSEYQEHIVKLKDLIQVGAFPFKKRSEPPPLTPERKYPCCKPALQVFTTMEGSNENLPCPHSITFQLPPKQMIEKPKGTGILKFDEHIKKPHPSTSCPGTQCTTCGKMLLGKQQCCMPSADRYKFKSAFHVDVDKLQKQKCPPKESLLKRMFQKKTPLYLTENVTNKYEPLTCEITQTEAFKRTSRYEKEQELGQSSECDEEIERRAEPSDIRDLLFTRKYTKENMVSTKWAIEELQNMQENWEGPFPTNKEPSLQEELQNLKPCMKQHVTYPSEVEREEKEIKDPEKEGVANTLRICARTHGSEIPFCHTCPEDGGRSREQSSRESESSQNPFPCFVDHTAVRNSKYPPLNPKQAKPEVSEARYQDEHSCKIHPILSRHIAKGIKPKLKPHEKKPPEPPSKRRKPCPPSETQSCETQTMTCGSFTIPSSPVAPCRKGKKQSQHESCRGHENPPLHHTRHMENATPCIQATSPTPSSCDFYSPAHPSYHRYFPESKRSSRKRSKDLNCTCPKGKEIRHRNHRHDHSSRTHRSCPDKQEQHHRRRRRDDTTKLTSCLKKTNNCPSKNMSFSSGSHPSISFSKSIEYGPHFGRKCIISYRNRKRSKRDHRYPPRDRFHERERHVDRHPPRESNMDVEQRNCPVFQTSSFDIFTKKSREPTTRMKPKQSKSSEVPSKKMDPYRNRIPPDLNRVGLSTDKRQRLDYRLLERTYSSSSDTLFSYCS